MEVLRDEPTEAFKKYVDPIFIIQNGLMHFASRTYNERLDPRFGYRLNNYYDECCLRAGMCVALTKKIQKELSFENTKQLFKQKALKLASNFDLDYVEVTRRKQKLDETLFSHAKLQYCFDKYLKEISLNNNISVLTCLMAMYSKILEIKKEKNPTERVQNIKLTNWYKYVREAMLEEEKFDIKNYSSMTLQELSDKLVDLMVECQYWLENSTEETSLSTDLETIIMDVFVVEENNNYKDFKEEFEQNIYDWLIEEMHKNENFDIV